MTSKSQITTKSGRPAAEQIAPVHPGEMLREEFMEPMGLSANGLAISIGVPATRISEILNERRGISGDTALRLGRYFRMSAQFWMNLQSHYELEVARTGLGKKWEMSIKQAPIDVKTGALLAKRSA